MDRNELQLIDYDYTSLVDFLTEESIKRKILVTYFNFNTSILLNKDTRFYGAVKNKFLFHCDGIGVYLFSKILFGTQFKNNINGSNLYPLLVNKLLESKKRIFIVFSANSESDFIKKSIEKIFSDCSGLVKYCIFNEETQDELLKTINDFNPEAVFVGTGQPDQEFWIINNKDCIKSNLLMSTGSGFEYLLCLKKRSPVWVQRIGFEWVYRLFQEPRRLWKRYILGIPIFMFNVISIKVKLLINKEST